MREPEMFHADSLIRKVRVRLQTRSIAVAFYVHASVLLVLSILVVLTVRLLGLMPRWQDDPLWLLVIPVLAVVGAILFHRRIRDSAAAQAIDRQARTSDLFLTYVSLATSAGEYQPLVAQSADQRAEQIQPAEVVAFHPGNQLTRLAGVAVLLGIAVWLTPRLDPFGKVAAVEQEERSRDEVRTIQKANEDRREQLRKKSREADELSGELDDRLQQLKSDYRKMRPNQQKANAKILVKHGSTLGEQWKAQSTEKLRDMLNRPISRQQMGGSRSAKMNQWLSDLQEGKTDSLQKQLKEAQQTMQALMEAKDPAEREKLADQLKRDLQDLKKFASDKAGSQELASALSRALKALEAGEPKGDSDSSQQPMSQDALDALRESLSISEQELEQLARTAKDLRKLEDALKTLKQAQNLNQNGQLDGEKLEGCETLADYAEMYAQMTGRGMGEGEKDLNEGGDGGTGAGGDTPEDDSQPEGYQDEKSKARIKAGKVLLSIKTREYAEEADFDPDALRKYRDSVNSLKDSVQSAIENEEIPPGYTDGIRSYFDRIETIDPALRSSSESP